MYRQRSSRRFFRDNQKRKLFGRKQKVFDPTNIIKNSPNDKRLARNENSDQYTVKNKFSDLAISKRLKINILSVGYKELTPIQDQAIPELLKGRDMVGIAKTGTGKTAAFLIPLINKVLGDRNEKVLILAPTRELAVQIRDEFEKFAKNLNIYSVLCIGGVGIHGQIKILNKNPHFVIGTPGRIKDLERNKKLNFNSFRNIVLDEVDHMLDMGFIDDVNYIISKLPYTKQSLFFSATITPKIQTVMNQFLKNPVRIQVASNQPTANVEQSIIRLNGRNKVDVLHEVLIQKDYQKVLIFGRTKHGIEKLYKELVFRGFKAASIHGNKSQNQRQKALNDFKNNHVQILLATDLASRGLDISNVTHVINYDLPSSYEDYIHRIGRTGRAGKLGKAITLI